MLGMEWLASLGEIQANFQRTHFESSNYRRNKGIKRETSYVKSQCILQINGEGPAK